MKREKIIIVFLLLVFPLLTGCGGFSSINMPVSDNSIFDTGSSSYPIEDLIYQDAKANYSENLAEVSSSPEKRFNEIKRDEKLILNYKLEEESGNIINDSSDNNISLSFNNILWKKGGIDISKLVISNLFKNLKKIVLNNSLINGDENIKVTAIIEPINNINFNSSLEFITKKDIIQKSINEIVENISPNFYISPKDIENIKKVNLSNKKSYFISISDSDGILKLSIDGKLIFTLQSLNDNSLNTIEFMEKFKYKLPIIIDSAKLFVVNRDK